jgi:hypothetical protein
MGHNFMLITIEPLPPLTMFLPLRERWEERVMKLLKTATTLLEYGGIQSMQQLLYILLIVITDPVPIKVLPIRVIMLFLQFLPIFTRTVSITLLVVT